ncbi:Uncharacterized protein FWK35_00023037 [Aphis craccivora]|uniref:Uncharacterized protein n=1 Tax=Aphis craccivora TaxID=307492 RepID=A0A6G0XP60_APHCR|nr:Uncharacterized protein FWK35_00023037 [Aphis craccivora]
MFSSPINDPTTDDNYDELIPNCDVKHNINHALSHVVYILVPKGPLKPKFHILTHYGRLFSIPCRINLVYTLARKLQLQTVNRLLTASGLQPDLKVGDELTNNVYETIPLELTNESYKVSWIEYKGYYINKLDYPTSAKTLNN